MTCVRIRIDYDAGEGELIFARGFFDQSLLWQVDVLQDIIAQAQAMYDECMGAMVQELHSAVDLDRFKGSP